MKNKTPKASIKCFSDYIVIEPNIPTGGTFVVGDTYIDEVGSIKSVGDKVSESVKKLIGKKVIFNSWACDKKKINGVDYYFFPESANMIVAIL